MDYQRKIARINKGFSNSAARIPYALLVLECGHFHAVDLKPGTSNPHDEANLVIPEACECKDCRQEDEELARVPELVAGSIYSRFKPHCGVNFIHFYKQDSTSPTGVRLLASIRHTTRAEDAIRAISSAHVPLSPTEGLASVR